MSKVNNTVMTQTSEDDLRSKLLVQLCDALNSRRIYILKLQQWNTFITQPSEDATITPYSVQDKLAKANPAEVVKQYTKDAEQGDANAQYRLGLCYMPVNSEPNSYATNIDHQILSVNPTRAFSLFVKAADQGHTDAKYMLGVCYKNGTGVVKDKEKVKAIFQELAQNGHEDAQTVLNTMQKNEGYINTAKKIGGGLLNVLGALGQGYLNAQSSQNTYYDDDDDDDDYY